MTLDEEVTRNNAIAGVSSLFLDFLKVYRHANKSLRYDDESLLAYFKRLRKITHEPENSFSKGGEFYELKEESHALSELYAKRRDAPQDMKTLTDFVDEMLSASFHMVKACVELSSLSRYDRLKKSDDDKIAYLESRFRKMLEKTGMDNVEFYKTRMENAVISLNLAKGTFYEILGEIKDENIICNMFADNLGVIRSAYAGSVRSSIVEDFYGSVGALIRRSAEIRHDAAYFDSENALRDKYPKIFAKAV